MAGYLALLLAAALLPAGQTAIVLEQRVISMTRNIGGSAALICEILSPKFDNIHWYRYQEGKAPQRLLRYSMKNSQSVLDPGIDPEKVRAYKGKDNSCRLILSTLQLGDSGMYHCAIWDGPQWHRLPQHLSQTCHLEKLGLPARHPHPASGSAQYLLRLHLD